MIIIVDDEIVTQVESARRRFQAADDEWSYELKLAFGRNAGDARYTPAGKGAPGSALAAAHARFCAARIEWETAKAKEATR